MPPPPAQIQSPPSLHGAVSGCRAQAEEIAKRAHCSRWLGGAVQPAELSAHMMMECSPERYRVQSSARLSPSFARGLPFAYQRCGEDWSFGPEFNEYLHKRASIEVELAGQAAPASGTAAQARYKRKGFLEGCSDLKRACQRPLQDVNPRAFGIVEPHLHTHAPFTLVRPSDGDGAAMQC